MKLAIVFIQGPVSGCVVEKAGTGMQHITLSLFLIPIWSNVSISFLVWADSVIICKKCDFSLFQSENWKLGILKVLFLNFPEHTSPAGTVNHGFVCLITRKCFQCSVIRKEPLLNNEYANKVKIFFEIHVRTIFMVKIWSISNQCMKQFEILFQDFIWIIVMGYGLYQNM